MTDTQALLSRAENDGERLLLRHVRDLALRVEDGSAVCTTAFLTPSEQALLRSCERHIGCGMTFFGGYDGADRSILALHPPAAPPDGAALPVSAVRLSHKAPLTHRDILGSMLALGIKRETLGDILVSEGRSIVILLSGILPFILDSCKKAGRTPVETAEVPLSEISPPEQKFEIIRATLQSLRLDAVISSGFGISRESAKEAIASGLVRLNYRETDSPSKQLGEGCVLSLRGKGKIVVGEIGGRSKKDRIWVTLKRYL
ncbi:MAG: RNA-binding protein [Oscillospiraceae bacterium]|jgi:RNA-binding protein YlmH|nr:RNA-binding protein [Oscillospiraceae bacterium]